MDENKKIDLMELLIGLREPENGMEKHFLKVIKGEARPCTSEEKEWVEWYRKTHYAKEIELKPPSNVSPDDSPKRKVKSSKAKRMPDRVLKILNRIQTIKSQDALDSKGRLPGSYGSGKKR